MKGLKWLVFVLVIAIYGHSFGDQRNPHPER